jgi:O-antigen/teichoic acid export membrane protein
MKTVLKPLISVLGGEAGVRIANLCLALLIARVFGGAALGVYAACIAVVTVAVMFSENGLQTTALLELSGEASGRGEIAGKLYLCKTVLTLVTLLILAGIGLGLKVSPFVWMVAFWVTLRTVLQSYSQLHMSFLKARSKADAIGPIQLAHALLLLIGILLTYKQGWGLFFLLAWFTAGQLCELALTGFAAWRTGIRPAWPSANFFWPTIRRSMPLGIGNGLANAIIRLDTIVLAALVTSSELGSFSAANTLLAVFYVACWLFGSVLLPEMVRLSNAPEALRTYTRKWAFWIVLTMTPCVLLAFWAAPKVMVLLYGPAFARSGALASTMALACPLILLNSLYANLAIATNSKAIYLGIFAATAAVTLALDFVFGRAFGSMGISFAIVIREAGMLAGFCLLMSRSPSPAAQVGYSITS